jgi:hypothetical protein
VILNVHVSVVLALSILEHMCLPRDLNVQVSVVLVLFIQEYLYLHRDIKCTSISGISVVHSGVHAYTP